MQPFAFISYARADDKRGHVTRFRERLSDEVQVLTGREFPIFQDNVHIHWGEDWKDRIKLSLNEVVFFIPILTPSFFNSDMCREEATLFLQREKALKRNDLILPVYLVDCDVLSDPSKTISDDLARLINRHQRSDWRRLRLKSFDDPEVNNAFEKLAVDIKKALQRCAHLSPGNDNAVDFDSAKYRLPLSLDELIAQLTAHFEGRLSPAQSSGSRSDPTRSRKRKRKNKVLFDGAERSKSLLKERAVGYDKSVFIGGPFSDYYQPMFEAIVFAVVYTGFRPISVFEATGSGSTPRLERIMRLIEQCKYGIFDLSPTKVTSGLPRFNPPFELGLFLGGWRYGTNLQRAKRVLVLDSQHYRYQKFISDLSERDIGVHANNPKAAIKVVCDWLADSSRKAPSRKPTSSAAEIFKRYTLFKKARLKLCAELGIQPAGFSYAEYNELITVWLREYEGLTAR